tara:strand:+ start:448 stop:780 length:333 start_codon:yes stop_codon:yes gene_type:complete
MMLALFDELRGLRSKTAILEALDWDDELLESFMKEVEVMLLASPPNVEKALFWIRNTPWDTFGKKKIPDEIYTILEKEIRFLESRFRRRLEASRITSLPHRDKNDFDGWN